MTTGAGNAGTAGFERASAVADAVLFEGYLLYPYRGSAAKNRYRWQFGVLAPRTWIRAHGVPDTGVAGSAESWFQQTECLLEADAATTLRIRLRFLQVQVRTVQRRRAGRGYDTVDELVVDGHRYVGFDEAVPRQVDRSVRLADLCGDGLTCHLAIPGGQDSEPVAGGRLVRRRWPVTASVTLRAEPADTPFGLHRLRVRTDNLGTVADGLTRDEVLRHSMVATHTLIDAGGGRFLSLLDPPDWAARAAGRCQNVHTFPVLAGEPGSADLLLSAPIILPDHPQVAPESPGDLFDATEIDEILSLRALTLTATEKDEARATDARAAAIVDRVEQMPPELLARLHGATRSLRPVPPATGPAAPSRHGGDGGWTERGEDLPWWAPGADASVHPETDTVTVGGVTISAGSRVRLRPRARGTDAHDMFLRGRLARVRAILSDVDERRYLAVILEDDPGADLHQWYGRFRYFSPQEVEPVADDPTWSP